MFLVQTGRRGAQALTPSTASNEPLAPAQLAHLLDRYARPLRLFASQWTVQPDDAVQEAWIELAGQIPPPADPVAWLFRVTKHRALNLSRAANRRQRRERHVARDESDRNSPSRKAEQSEEDRLVIDALGRLATDDRELIVLRLWSDLGWEQIGELTGRSKSTAHRQYQRALSRLRQILGPEPTGQSNPHPLETRP